MATRATKPAKGAHLTASQKAEAITLWKTGSVTLDDLAKRFNKRPETFSRLFSKVGVKKGEDAAALAAQTEAAVKAKILGSIEVNAERIAQSREQHFKMSDGLAKLAWSELVRARQTGIDIAGLKDLMQTLKLAGEVIGAARKELWQVLGVDEQKDKDELESLPELTVRELTQGEVEGLASQGEEDEMGVGLDVTPVASDGEGELT